MPSASPDAIRRVQVLVASFGMEGIVERIAGRKRR
jgi:hypothetical protein